MRVDQAKAIAREWVQEQGASTPGIVGAFLAGSINWQPADAELPAGSDLDIMLILDTPDPGKGLGKFCYRDVLLEVSFLSNAQFQTPEAILGDYHLAPSFVTGELLLDTTGRLREMQQTVQTHYPEHQWVQARCAQARDRVVGWVSGWNPEAPLPEQVTSLVFGTGVMTHVLLVAGLRNPTVRTRYIAVRDLLATHNRPADHEQLLELAGFAGVNRERVEHHLHALTDVFNAAVQVEASEYRFGSDISEEARPIAIDGTWQMIQNGHHREALFWIIATWGRCLAVLQTAEPEASASAETGYAELAQEIGLGFVADRRAREAAVLAALPWLDEVAEAVIAGTPGVRA